MLIKKCMLLAFNLWLIKKRAWIFSILNKFIFAIIKQWENYCYINSYPQNTDDYTHQTFLIITKIVHDWAFILAKFLFLLNVEQIVYGLEMSLEQTISRAINKQNVTWKIREFQVPRKTFLGNHLMTYL